jgi:hypothetical protein
MLHVDDPLHAYVRDSNGKVWWGGAAPIFARMVDNGWKPRADTDPRLLKRMDNSPEPKPVYPGWQVWKPKKMRGRLFRRNDLVRRPT